MIKYNNSEQLLYDGKNVFYRNGNYLWNDNLGIAYYENTTVAVSYNICYWENGNLAWDGNIKEGYYKNGMILTYYGVALELNTKFTLLCDKDYLTLVINRGKYKNDTRIILQEY